jgi:hypothetical protein
MSLKPVSIRTDPSPWEEFTGQPVNIFTATITDEDGTKHMGKGYSEEDAIQNAERRMIRKTETRSRSKYPKPK